jgi:hypothetical protein
MARNPSDADPPVHAIETRRRRWLQYRLRSLLVLMFLVGIAMTWLVSIKTRADRQAAIVATILKHGAVGYDYERDASDMPVHPPKIPGPAWLRKLLGDDFFVNVVAIDTGNDAVLEDLRELPYLRVLHLNDSTAITDKSLDRLRQLDQLEQLVVARTSLTDSGLASLEGLHKLRALDLRETQTTDAGLEHLRGLMELRELCLYRTKITDVGLEHLKELSQLESLNLGETMVTNDGLVHLEAFRQLRALDLHGIAVTDAGLERLRRNPNLTALWLEGPQITDIGLRQLQELRKLRALELVNTSVTREGLAGFQRALPDCSVKRPK